MHKIGFACKIVNPTPRIKKTGEAVFEQFDNCKVGVIRKGQYEILSESQRVTKLNQKVKSNINALVECVKYVATLPEDQRFFRIGSDLLPFFDHPEFVYDYKDDLLKFMERQFHMIGLFAKAHGIRLTAHPDQFTTLNSVRADVCENSMRTLRSHIDMFRMMGLTPDDGVVINIHCNGQSWTMPEEVREIAEWLSLENDEKQAGHEKTLKMCEEYGIRYVFDIHHYFCENGTWFDTKSDDFQRILATWPKTQTPKFHLSQSRGTSNFRELCAHSDYITDPVVIEQARIFSQYGDIMVEAKMKNLAAQQLHSALEKLSCQEIL